MQELLCVKALLCKAFLCVKSLRYEVVLGSTLCKLVVRSFFWEVLGVVLGSPLCKLCSTKSYWEVLCVSFVVRSSTGKSFVQAL